MSRQGELQLPKVSVLGGSDQDARIQAQPFWGCVWEDYPALCLDLGNYPDYPVLAFSVEVLTLTAKQRKCSWEIGRQYQPPMVLMETIPCVL